MKTLVIYYSRTGSTRALAEKLAEERQADLYEVKLRKPLSTFGAFLMCPAAMGHKPTAKAVPIEKNLSDYDRIVIMGPVWASNPAPPVNNIIMALPQGKEVELRLVSSGSGSKQDAVKAFVESRGCTVVEYVDVKKNQENAQ